MNTRVEEIDLLAMIRPVREARKFIAAGLLAGVTLGAIAGVLLPRKFEASATVVIVDQSAASMYSRMMGQFSGLVSALGAGGLGNASYADEAVAVLKSRDLAAHFVASVDGKKVLFADDWDHISGTWKDPDEVPSEADIWEEFDTRVRTATYDSKTGIVTVTINLDAPDLAAKWVSEYVAMADQTLRERAKREARTRLEHLQARLASVGPVELRQSINELVEIELNKEMIASVGSEYTYRVIDPPLVPDPDDYVSPNLVLLLLGGAVGGMLSGFALHRWLSFRKSLT